MLPSLIALLAACTGGTPEVPGDLPNPKLAEMIDTAIAEEIARMNPVWSPGLLPQAPEQARRWIQDIEEVVARCSHGPGVRSERNRLEYDLTLRDGQVITGVHSGQRCLYDVARPLVMRVKFAQGRADTVLTDGREREHPVDAARSETGLLARRLVRLDWDRRPHLYFPPDKSASDIAREWSGKGD